MTITVCWQLLLLPCTSTTVHVTAFVPTGNVAGQVMCGASVSSTVTDCVQVLLLPPRSVTVQVTSVVPTENVAGASLVTLPTPQLSAATGTPRSRLATEH